jgi:hypothetical protein
MHLPGTLLRSALCLLGLTAVVGEGWILVGLLGGTEVGDTGPLSVLSDAWPLALLVGLLLLATLG